MPLETLISGGQTGADRGALDAAIRHGFPHGGWCPRGRRAEDGPIDPRYALTETPDEGYAQRTEWNVRDSDGTVVLTLGTRLTGGSLFTVELAGMYRRPCLHLSRERDPRPAEALARFVGERGIRRLNVAGPRESHEPGIGVWVAEVIEVAFFGRCNAASSPGFQADPALD